MRIAVGSDASPLRPDVGGGPLRPRRGTLAAAAS